MTNHQVDHLNSFFMVIAAAGAWVLPLELFLFSYVVLGPLHYFTEISWLHDRNYFCLNKFHVLPLYFLALVSFIFTVIIGIPLNALIVMAFILAGLSIATGSWLHYLLAFIVLVPLSQWLTESRTLEIIFAVFLPTIIHVFLFTFLFLLWGGLKSNRVSAYGSVVVFVVCAICVILLPINTAYQAHEAVTNTVRPFFGVATHLSNIFNALFSSELFTAEWFMRAFRFMAFAYTYHYLNWFTKVRSIGWSKVSKSRGTLIILAWISSLLIYWYDFTLGLKVLFLFSLLHVLLEFPLNFKSIQGINHALIEKIRGRQRLMND